MRAQWTELRIAQEIRKRWPPMDLILTSGHVNIRDHNLPGGLQVTRLLDRLIDEQSNVRVAPPAWTFSAQSDGKPASPDGPSALMTEKALRRSRISARSAGVEMFLSASSKINPACRSRAAIRVGSRSQLITAVKTSSIRIITAGLWVPFWRIM